VQCRCVPANGLADVGWTGGIRRCDEETPPAGEEGIVAGEVAPDPGIPAVDPPLAPLLAADAGDVACAATAVCGPGLAGAEGPSSTNAMDIEERRGQEGGDARSAGSQMNSR
jgi:hypothetical protein